MNDILAVIPTYNERESIQDITRAVFREYEALDILFVDDNSPDGTGQLADAIAAKDPRVHVLHRSGKQGLGRAYIAGFKWALEQSYQFI
ncbi:MAG: glycosyltransferase, partial [Kiritimatiellae bacterium]|nr:glycosyltransferase [Kiritimatiellia bacterium]